MSSEGNLILQGMDTYDGAGVRLKRIFGSPDTFSFTDPFLLLDFFGSNNPEEYMAGFPWHPHRGIETLTYVIKGEVEHEDSIGNKGTIRSGEIQWMKAGSGIYHQEMPKTRYPDKDLWGFQLWINIPSSEKMSRPVYRSINYGKLETVETDMFRARVIEGNIDQNGMIMPGSHNLGISYIDITSKTDKIILKKDYNFTGLIVPMEGTVSFKGHVIKHGEALLIDRMSSHIELSGAKNSRFLYISGRPTKEEIAWYGPIVMNSWDQIQAAVRDLRNGTFIRNSDPLFME